MNRNRSWSALCAAAVWVLALSGCATQQQALSDQEAYQRFVGTWVNTGYAGTPEQVQVQVNKPDYAMEEWLTLDSAGPTNQWKAAIKKTWLDEKGKTYCQYTAASTNHPGWLNAWLMRVDKARKVLEFQYGGATTSEGALAFPETVDPNDRQNYWVYYRRK
jgi:hypothetical protein